MKNLIIVESPAKAKTIKNFLGNDYEVIASKGHIRDLPKKEFGIEISENGFTPKYVISADHKKIVSEIKKLAKDAKEIYLATDEDREGEAIAFHIASAIGKDGLKLPRIVFHEITKNAISKALDNPRQLDMPSVNAQQTRRLLDRIVGYKLSPLLSLKIQKGLSAGRVQSVALRTIVDREQEIRDFVPLRYFSLDMKFKKDLEAELIEYDKQKIEKLSITNEDRAKLIKDELDMQSFKVSDIKSSQRSIAPQPPFMTSSLQQSASNILGFSPKKTMILAQNLYEGVNTNDGFMGAITYMRTDSLNLATEAVDMARKLILEKYGEKYLPKNPQIYNTKSKGAQEAHEAIRPTNLNFSPEIASKFLEKDMLKLYTLIYNRFLACQMSPCLSESQNVLVSSQKAIFKISGKKIVFDGFYKVFGDMDKDKILPPLKKGEDMEVQSLELNENFTQPPNRYSEAGLIKKLESLGVGRPSTYAPTISLLSSRNYVEIEKKQLLPSPIAFDIINLLKKHFADIVDSDFTSQLEEKLDEIATKNLDWQKVLKEFYYPFIEKIDSGKNEIKSQKIATPTGEICPDCNGELVKRRGRFGEFIACGNYPKCKFSKNIGEKKEEKKINTIGVQCPQCSSDLVQRIGKKGKFYACSAYPKCKFISTYMPSGQNCQECGNILVIKELKKGKFLACTTCKTQNEIKEEGTNLA